MKILVLGSGLMGPAAAYQAATDPAVSQVIICDMSQEQLAQALTRLTGIPGAEKLGIVKLDLTDIKATAHLMHGFDAIVSALPQFLSGPVIRAALHAGRPLVDLARPPEDELPALQTLAQTTGGLVVLGCGLEPGLTEIMARHLAEKLDHVDELHIKCGGIPEKPAPPLGYKIVFGGRQLPLRESDAQQVNNGQLEPVARYSGVEPVTFAGLGECEAWHEGFVPWLLNLPIFQNLKSGTQKTIRWPGYAAKVTVLKEMGLLSQTPVQVDGVSVIPKNLLDTLLYPRVKMEAGERDMTLFRVELLGRHNGQSCRAQAQMVDYFDPVSGFTSMARTTAFTGAIVAQLIVQHQLRATGLIHPEQIITGPLFDQLLDKLSAKNINFTISIN